MNDPLVVQLSKSWAERARETVSGNDDEAIAARIEWMYVSGFARRPADLETEFALRYLKAQATARSVDLNDASLWADFAHALVNTKEFIFLR